MTTASPLQSRLIRRLDHFRCPIVAPAFDQVNAILGETDKPTTWRKAKVCAASSSPISQPQHAVVSIQPKKTYIRPISVPC